MSKFTFVFSLILVGVYGCKHRGSSSDAAVKNIGYDTSQYQALGMALQEGHQLFWHWEDEFKQADKVKLKSWLVEVTNETFKTLGQYPFDLHYYFHQSDGDEPVPFGHTSRDSQQAVHFYVNPSYALADFLADWTAPHEISHLSICFVGRKNMWFSEGYATYLSRQIMVDMGRMTQVEFDSLYYQKIKKMKAYYNSSTSTFIAVSDSLLSKHRYGPIYWAGSSFFCTADAYLRERYNMRFVDLIKTYQGCCRLKDQSLKSIMTSFDDIIDDHFFAELMKTYRHSPSSEVMAIY